MAVVRQKCCGPAGNPTDLNTGFEIAGEIYIPVGEHRGSHETWVCLESVQTGERIDVKTLNLDVALALGNVLVASDMEVIAWMANRE